MSQLKRSYCKLIYFIRTEEVLGVSPETGFNIYMNIFIIFKIKSIILRNSFLLVLVQCLKINIYFINSAKNSGKNWVEKRYSCDSSSSQRVVNDSVLKTVLHRVCNWLHLSSISNSAWQWKRNLDLGSGVAEEESVVFVTPM